MLTEKILLFTDVLLTMWKNDIASERTRWPYTMELVVTKNLELDIHILVVNFSIVHDIIVKVYYDLKAIIQEIYRRNDHLHKCRKVIKYSSESYKQGFTKVCYLLSVGLKECSFGGFEKSNK